LKCEEEELKYNISHHSVQFLHYRKPKINWVALKKGKFVYIENIFHLAAQEHTSSNWWRKYEAVWDIICKTG
jgi:hypothetical protein